MGMEFTPADVQRWPYGEQMADIYERSMMVARQLPRYGLGELMVRMNPGEDRPTVSLGFRFMTDLRVGRQMRRDAPLLAAKHIPDAAFKILGRDIDIIGIPAGPSESDKPPMHDKTWSMLQEHWELVKQLPLPIQSVSTTFHDPYLTRQITHYDSIYPSLHTKVKGAFTSLDEKLDLGGWLHNTDVVFDGQLSAYAASVEGFYYKAGQTNPSLFEANILDCSPKGWDEYHREEEAFLKKYPGDIIPGLDGPLPEDIDNAPVS